MNKNFLLIFAILITFTLIPFSFSATYINNGIWKNYTAGLDDYFYQDDLFQNTNNRNFETAFSLTTGVCDDFFCSRGGSVERSFVNAESGSYSAKLTSTTFHSATEFSGSADFSFYYKDGAVSCGYVNDANEYRVVSSFGNVASWTKATCSIPNGLNRWAIAGSGYVDSLKILSNNTGTFRVGDISCSSMESCSNIEGFLPAKNFNSLYWVVDYVSGASCSSNYGNMVNIPNTGLYYVLVNESISDFSKDIVLSATCSRVPFLSKGFYNEVTLYKHGLINNGSFEEPFDLYVDAGNYYDAGIVENSDYFLATNRTHCTRECGPVNSRFSNSSDNVESGNFSGYFLHYVGSYAGSSSPSADTDTFTKLMFNQEFDVGVKINIKYVWDWYFQNYNSNDPTLTFGFFNDSNQFLSAQQVYLGDGSIDLIIPQGYNKIGIIHGGGARTYAYNLAGHFYSKLYLDVIVSDSVKRESSFNVTNSLNNNIGDVGTVVSFYSEYLDEFSSPILNADCNTFVGSTKLNVSYNSALKKYVSQFGFTSQGIFPVTSVCSSENFNSHSESYNINIGMPVDAIVDFEAIQNVGSNADIDLDSIRVYGGNNVDDMIFRLRSNVTQGKVRLKFSDYFEEHNHHYFIFTSPNGVDWVFSDTLTFGASNSTPVQKIWNGSWYDVWFDVDLVSGQNIYYKIVYQNPAYYSEVINNSVDWFNQYMPSNFLGVGGKNYDLFNDSNYSNVQSYTINNFQNLVSGNMSVGYELQFTAHGDENGELLVGYRPVLGADSVSSVAVTTVPTRFSVPISPSARDSKLLFKSVSSESNTYYITDYAIVPRSYFYNQLEVLNPDRTQLASVLRNGVSTQFVKEGEGVILKTSMFDVGGDLSKLEIQTYLEGVLVKTQFVTLDTGKGKYFNFEKNVDGVIDLNGVGGELTTTNALRTITYKIVLYNSLGQNVSEQSKTFSLLQFPYFPNDFKLSAEILNTKLGTNPKLRLNIQSKVPKNVLGVEFIFYDSSHSILTPNYSEIIYAKDLKCASFTSCTKEILFNNYVWEKSGDYTVLVTALLSTENKNYLDAYASIKKHAVITPSGYLLVQLIQYHERHQNATPHTPYNSTEKIPLMLGVADDMGKNLEDTITPYFWLNVDGVDFDTKYFPDAFNYDETSGTNVWLWNQYLYDDAGNLLPDMNEVKFRGVLVDKRQSQSVDSNFAFANRCMLYPVDIVGNSADYIVDGINWLGGMIGGDIFNWKIKNNSAGWIASGVNLFGSVAGTIALNGCVAYPPNIVGWGDGNESVLTIDDSFDLSAHSDNRQALYCGQKYDNNKNIDMLGDDFGCVLLIHEDLQQIDQVNIQIGNTNSDYSVVNENKQYLDFTITGNDIIFNDLGKILYNWNQKGYFGDSPMGSPTLKDIIVSAWHEIFTPNLSNSQIAEQYRFTEIIGGDGNYNFKTDYNAGVYNKAIFFKISGLDVMNVYDYLTPAQRDGFNAKNFLSYARTNNLNVYPKPITVSLYSNRTEIPFRVIETLSPIVINKVPSQKQQVVTGDGSIILTDAQEILPFHVVSIMSSSNSTKNDRLVANLQFRKIIRAVKIGSGSGGGAGGLVGDVIPNIIGGVNSILYGEDDKGNPEGLFNAPMVFFMNNILIEIALLFLIIIFALVIRSLAPMFRGS